MYQIDLLKTTAQGCVIEAKWNGSLCDLFLHNPTEQELTLGEITLSSGSNPFPSTTKCYGEGYNKLAQYGGTIADFQLIGSFDDHAHYKLPKLEGYQQAYNMMLFSLETGEDLLIGFTSCHRFTGIFRFNEKEFQILINCENIVIKPKETLPLEQFFLASGSRNQLLRQFGEAISKNHPRLPVPEIPTGWCSWLAYGPSITEENISENMLAIKERQLDLKYIQIDDGYQPYMGDWLSATNKFESGVQALCKQIKDNGFEPALWVAPFIAEKSSELFKSHPDWFVKDASGKPLPSNEVSFGGWRCGPWYMLDGTNPQARAHLTRIFRILREEWGISYFKLDANMWGALPMGERYEPNRTAVEAYRMGMEAILEGAGRDSFILGCNAPMWPSLGMVHGMRLTNDNAKTYRSFTNLARECFFRNWQHEVLWVNDPDAFILTNDQKPVIDPTGAEIRSKKALTEDELLLDATYVLASGGMVLSGDNITQLDKEHASLVKKMIPSVGVAAEFEDDTFEVGRAALGDTTELLYLFNYGDVPKTYPVTLSEKAVVTNFWTGETLDNKGDSHFTLPPHSSVVLRCELVR